MVARKSLLRPIYTSAAQTSTRLVLMCNVSPEKTNTVQRSGEELPLGSTPNAQRTNAMPGE